MLAINNLDTPVDSLIILEASDEYLFVETGPEGEVEHFKPSLVRGEKHHLVTVSSIKNKIKIKIIFLPFFASLDKANVNV